MEHEWSPIGVDEVRARFEPFEVDWWVAGGVAIDLFVGWQTRPHEDLDIEMFRGDRDVLFDVFDGWELQFVSAGQLHPFARGQTIPDSVFGVWGRSTSGGPWEVEVMLCDGDGETWRFRRDNEIHVPRARLTSTAPSGLRYCVPEVQLLFKAKKHRPKDDIDMVRCLPRMTSSQLLWLSAALERSEPGHPWLELIRMSEM